VAWFGNEYPCGKHVIWTQQRKEGNWVAGSTPPLPKGTSPIVADTEQQAIAAVRNAIGTTHPNYFGMDEAINRFRRHKPDAFQGSDYVGAHGERRTKMDASTAIDAILTADQAVAWNKQSDPPQALRDLQKAFRTIGKTNPVMPTWMEYDDLSTVIEGEAGPGFIAAAAKFTMGHHASGLQGMKLAMGHKRFNWAVATYLPFLWQPDVHMFLKPVVTKDYAERIGHPFWIEYRQGLEADVYDSLLDLADHTRIALTTCGLTPIDNIDVQSFIWVVGAYPA